MECESYRKILVAKHSPKNECNAQDGDVLTIVPRRTVPQKTTVSHHFVSAQDGKTKSKYGWVEDVGSFTLEDFLADDLGKPGMSESGKEHVRIMLSSIQELPAGTPTTATYRSRGTIQQRMELTVHKVLFCKS